MSVDHRAEAERLLVAAQDTVNELGELIAAPAPVPVEQVSASGGLIQGLAVMALAHATLAGGVPS